MLQEVPTLTFEMYQTACSMVGDRMIYNESKNPYPEDSYYTFLKFFWPEVIQDKYIDNWHVRELCGRLQKLGERVIERKPRDKDLLINISPGESKSSIVSVFFPVWLWIHDPTLRILSSSHSVSLSQEHAALSRELIRSKMFQTMFGDRFTIDRKKDSTSRYWTTSGGRRVCAGVRAKVTGKHFHVILADDLIDAQGVISKSVLRDAKDHIDYLETRKAGANREVAVMVQVMQRVHEQDTAGHWLETKREEVDWLCLPATIDYPVFPPELMLNYVDGFMNKARTGAKILKGFMQLGSTRYANQFGQSAVANEGGILKREYFEIVDAKSIPQDVWRQVRINFYADTADKAAEHNDPTGQIACFYYNGFLYIVDYINGRWKFNDRKKNMLEQFERWASVDSVLKVEPKSSGNAIIQSLEEPPYELNVTEWRTISGGKEQRLDVCMGVIESHRIKIIKDDLAQVGRWNEAFISELVGFGKVTHDEAVDCLVMAIVDEVLRNSPYFERGMTSTNFRKLFEAA